MEKDNLTIKKTVIISILVLIGFIITIDLAYIYHQANFNQFALPSFCTISDLIDCDGVAKTTEAQFLGVPLAYWGMFLYTFIIMLLSVDVLKKIPFLKFLEVFKNKFHYIASLGIISFTISMILLCVSLFGIHKLCIMCAITYVINLFIGIFAILGLEVGFAGAIKQSFVDFIEALKPLPYRVAFIIVMLLASVFLGWTYTSAKFSPALKSQRNYGEFINSETNKYAVRGNLLGSDKEDAVVINVYSDYMCPMCAVFNKMIHKAAKEFKNIRIEHHHLPLDMECNKHLQQPFHHGSCTAAKYAQAAHLQGKFWEVNSLLFDKKPDSEDKIIELLKTSDFDIDIEKLKKDAYSDKVNEDIQKDIEFAVKNGQIGTPVMNFKDEFEMGIPQDGYPGLKKWIIKHGGKPNRLF